jgi:hypothetical protein
MDDAESERRRAERIGTEGLFRAQLAMEAEVLTISSRGMMVRLSFAPELGSHHSFTLTFGSQTLPVLGTIRNVEARDVSGRGSYDVGVEFEGIGSREEESLERFVTSKLEAPDAI